MSEARKSAAGLRGVPGAVLSYFELLKPQLERFAKAWEMRSMPYENAKPGDTVWVWNFYGDLGRLRICQQIVLDAVSAPAHRTSVNTYVWIPYDDDGRWEKILWAPTHGPDDLRRTLLWPIVRLPWTRSVASA